MKLYRFASEQPTPRALYDQKNRALAFLFMSLDPAEPYPRHDHVGRRTAWFSEPPRSASSLTASVGRGSGGGGRHVTEEHSGGGDGSGGDGVLDLFGGSLRVPLAPAAAGAAARRGLGGGGDDGSGEGVAAAADAAFDWLLPPSIDGLEGPSAVAAAASSVASALSASDDVEQLLLHRAAAAPARGSGSGRGVSTGGVSMSYARFPTTSSSSTGRDPAAAAGGRAPGVAAPIATSFSLTAPHRGSSGTGLSGAAVSLDTSAAAGLTRGAAAAVPPNNPLALLMRGGAAPAPAPATLATGGGGSLAPLPVVDVDGGSLGQVRRPPPTGDGTRKRGGGGDAADDEHGAASSAKGGKKPRTTAAAATPAGGAAAGYHAAGAGAATDIDPSFESNPWIDPVDGGSFSRAKWVREGISAKWEWMASGGSAAAVMGAAGGGSRAPLVRVALQALLRVTNNLGLSREALQLFLRSLQPPTPGAAGGSASSGPVSVSVALVGNRAHPSQLVAAVLAVKRRVVLPAAASSTPSGSGSSSGGAALRTEVFVLPLTATRVLLEAQGAQYGAQAAALPHDYDAAHPDETAAAAAAASGDAHAPPTRPERWAALAAVLCVPGLTKIVWDAKAALYALLRCPLTARAPVCGLWDPLVAAYTLNPDAVGAGNPAPPAWALCLRQQQQESAAGGSGGGSSTPSSASASPLSAAAAAVGASSSSGDSGLSLAAVAAAYRVAPPAPSAGPHHPVLAHVALLSATAEVLARELDACGLRPAFERLEMPVVPALAAVEVAGVAFAGHAIQASNATVEGVLKLLEARAHALAGVDFLVTSPAQVAEVMYGRLGYAPPAERAETHTKNSRKGDKRHPSVDERALEGLRLAAVAAGQPGRAALPETLLQFRKLHKLATGFMTPLQTLAVASGLAATAGDEDGDDSGDGLGPRDASLQRLHTHLHQTRTGTGRLSSSDPNLQNLPTAAAAAAADDGGDGEELLRLLGGANVSIRSAFRASGPGCVLVSVDYSQIEMRVAAHVTGDARLAQAFSSAASSSDGGSRPADIYAAMAAQVFGARAPGDVTPPQRQAAKTVMLGLLYGMGAGEACAKLGVSEAEAGALRAQFVARYAGVARFVGAAREFARRWGYVPTLAGRRRPLPEARDANPNRAHYALRQAVNAIVQGTAADIIKTAMVLVDRALRQRQPPAGGAGSGGGGASSSSSSAPAAAPAAVVRGRLVMQIHDELLLECPADSASVAALVTLVTRVMEVDVPRELAAVAGAPGGVFAPAGAAWRAGEAAEAAELLGRSPRLAVPLTTSVEVGAEWGALAPWPTTSGGGS